jgi:hypothetical protein
MADYRAVIGVAGSRPRFFTLSVPAKCRKRRTEPDLDLIKQVEQVTRLVGERPARRLPGFGAKRSGAAVIRVFLIRQLLGWLIFRCKNSENSQERPRATRLRRGRPAMLPAPSRRFHEPGYMGCPTPSSAKFGETDRGNLACCAELVPSRRFRCCVSPRCATLADCSARRRTRAPLRRSFRVTVIISAVPSGGELTE